MKVMNESQILDQTTRYEIIKDIQCNENKRRKAKAFKAYQCLKDKTSDYVIELLYLMFDARTVIEMQYSLSNMSILRKIVDKLARVYQNGVTRTVQDSESDTAAIQELAKEIHMDTAMKKLNKYLKAFKNCIAYPRPYVEENGKMELTVDVLPPFLYDVVENPNCPEEPMVVIVSDYSPDLPLSYSFDAASAGRQPNGPNIIRPVVMTGDGRDSAVADKPFEKIEDNKKRYIWWTKSYHFTTNDKGEIVPNENTEDPMGIDNPIMMLPFVNFAVDQDGHFWAEGGDDLIDGSIKVNTLLTHLNHIAIVQGYGQLYMTGKNLPKSVKVGPNQCIQLEHAEGEPIPTVGFLTAGPPIGDIKELVEANIAMILTTNNLSTSNFSTSLSTNAKNFSSGVAQLIDKAESIEDVNEQAQIFKDKEPEIWEIISAWMTVLSERGMLTDELSQMAIPQSTEVILDFPSHQPVVSESDQLDIMQKRKDLGIASQLDLIMIDNPGITKEEAQSKLDQIQSDKKVNVVEVPQPNQPPMNPQDMQDQMHGQGD